MDAISNPEIALSTSDNPYDPLTDYDRWDAYDRQHGYDTAAYLARIVRSTTEYGEANYTNDIERAIDEAVLLDLISWTHEGVSYIKVVGKPTDSDDTDSDTEASA